MAFKKFNISKHNRDHLGGEVYRAGLEVSERSKAANMERMHSKMMFESSSPVNDSINRIRNEEGARFDAAELREDEI